MLQCGTTQILPLRQVALRRLHTLSSASPHLLGAVKCQNGIEFETDVHKFCAVVQAGFGHFANANDGSGTACCEMIDNSLCVSGETNPKRDAPDVSSLSVSKVCASACKLLMLDL